MIKLQVKKWECFKLQVTENKVTNRKEVHDEIRIKMYSGNERFEAFTAMKFQVEVFWVVTPIPTFRRVLLSPSSERSKVLLNDGVLLP
jgi:hypothetical protein